MNRPRLGLRCVAFIVAALLLVPLTVCAQEQLASPPDSAAGNLAPVPVARNYQIKPEDVLKVDVWGEPTLTNLQTPVTPDGLINVAYLGEIEAEGLTLPQLTEELVRRFEAAEILINPKIQVTLLQIHPMKVRVMGEVKRPGEYQFKPGDRLLDAVAQAGSYTDNAWLEQVTITRKGSDAQEPIDLRKMLKGDLSQNRALEEGDAIHIPPEDYQNKIYVLGQVMRPGIYDLKEKTTVLSAVSLASGPTERGSLKSTVVVRGNPANPERVPCDLTKLFDKADLSQDIVLEPGDVVIVPETKQPDWGKISQVLSTILSFSYLGRSGLF